MERADCHCHTIFSDGALTPLELIDLAKEKELSGLSITDHDSIGAYESALPYAKQLGIELISGIEISAEHQKYSIHVLGYSFDLKNDAIPAFCQKLQQGRTERNLEILNRLSRLNMPMTLEEIQERFPHGTLGRPHIAKMMVEKKYVKSVKQAFDRYIGNQSRCYVGGFQVAVEEAIELIHRANGFAILAHPHVIKPRRILPELYAMPFDGIEGYYAQLSLGQVQPWLDIARKKSWLVTGGSDFHGGEKAYPSLGRSWTPPENFAVLRERFRQHS
ncbi:MAG: PHP domain-containing protein [Candidatus Berkiellales bacterium]